VRFCRSRWSDYIRADLPCHVLQRSELLLIDQIELGDEVVEVFVAGVDVGLGADAHDPVEAMNVDVNKDSVEPGQDLLALWLEGLREWNVRGDRKQRLVIDLGLYPVHEERDVLRGGQLHRLLVLDPVLPQVLELRPPRHGGAALSRALFTHCAVDQIDSVEEVHDVHSEPIVEVLPLGQLDDLPEVDPGVEAGLGLLVQGILHRPRLELLLWPKCFFLVKYFTEFCEIHDDGQ